MKIKHTVLGFVILILVSAITSQAMSDSHNTSDSLAGRLRAGYMASSDLDILPQMANAGMNTVMPKFDPFTIPCPKHVIKEIHLWSFRSAQYNMRCMPVINFWSGTDARDNHVYNPTVFDNGKVMKNLPCPYTKTFWDEWVSPRVLKMVQIAETPAIPAVLIDLELYRLGGISDYTHGCYCDQCFTRYLSEKKQIIKLPIMSKRAKVVSEAGDLTLYQSIQSNAVRSYAAAIREGAQKIRPDIRLGALKLDDPIPLQKGIAMGFGSPQTPVFCFTEETYSKGCSTEIDSIKSYFRDMGAYVDLVVGLWQSRIPLNHISEHLYHSARVSKGYWIFTMHSFKYPLYLPLTGSISDNWLAIAKANSELDKLDRMDSYSTTFMARSFQPTPNWEWYKIKEMRANPVFRKQPLPQTFFRKDNVIYFYVQKGDMIDFQIERRQVGTYPDNVNIGVVAPDGSQLGYGSATSENPYSIKTQCTRTGVYGIILQAGRNAAEFVKSSHAYAADSTLDDGTEFITKIPPLFIAIDMESQSSIELDLWTQNMAESVKGSILSKDGTLLWSGIVYGTTRVKLNKPKGEYLEVRFTRFPLKSFGTVRVKVLKGALPLIAIEPAGLLFGK